jgi:Flp pilus assembly protein TadD
LALAAIERLHVDGVEDPSFRQLAAAAILRIAESVAPDDQPGQRQRWSLLRGDALAWSGQWQQARDLFRELAAGPPTDGAALRHGAATLAALEDRDAVIASIEMWNRFAAGVPQGSADWHAAKLATAEAMARAGQASEASRLARYVLLTTPPDDAELKARYERFAQPPP